MSLSHFMPVIDGRRVSSADGATFESINPATGEAWCVVERAGGAEAELAVDAAARAFSSEQWASISQTERGRLLHRLADLIARDGERLAKLETSDNGKLLREMEAQARTVPDGLRYFAGLADKVEGRSIPLERTSVLNYTLREPLGVVVVITPWNSPMFLTMMAVAPALAAGNTVVVKPSEVTSASMLEVAALATEAGFPPGVFNALAGDREVAEALVKQPAVAKVSLTGGTQAGQAVAIEAGRKLVPTTLELGGKSPNIVFSDADRDAAEAGLLAGIFAAAGQTCVAGSRAFVHEDLFDEMRDRLVARAEAVVVGDPLAPQTQMGPLATRAQLEKVERVVAEALADGAEVIAGGRSESVEGMPAGYFYRPTIVAGAGNRSGICREEIFGPVLTLFSFADEDEVVALANDTDFGLAAGVWTNDVRRAHRMARRLHAGTVWINTYRGMAFNSPFGGYKMSGIGRQNGVEAIDEYLQTKSVWCELDDSVQDPFVIRT